MSSNKQLSMRARNLDASRPVAVYYPGDIPPELATECASISRAVHTLPSGMEKEEEQESHLQEAILARQANSAGVAVENHVIPTPKVDASSTLWYQRTYVPKERPETLIRIQTAFGFEEELPEYDIDSEDEQWLERRSQIDPVDALQFERIMELLENGSSENQICLPHEAKVLLSKFDEAVAYDVYDYWLQKKRKAAEHHNYVLIPRIRTEPKVGTTGANPYVAFRRRAEKMQTRKNRKNDEESYEKILKLKYDTRRAVTLFDMLRQRERTKNALVDLTEQIFNHRVEQEELLNGVDSCEGSQPSTSADAIKLDGVNRSPRKKRKPLSLSMNSENEVVTKNTLKRNEDVWSTISAIGSACSAPVASTSSLDDPNVRRIDSSSEVDGKFEFVRRRGCTYRAPLPKNRPSEQDFIVPPPQQRFYKTNIRNEQGEEVTVIGRPRVNRTGTRVMDVLEDDPSASSSSDPFMPYILDTSRSYRAVTPRSDEEEEQEPSDRERPRCDADDLSDAEPMVYMDDCALEKWVKGDSDCFFTVGGKRRIPIIPVRTESEEDFFEKPPTNRAKLDRPLTVNYGHIENGALHPSLARLAPSESANREHQVPALLPSKKRTAVVAPFSCPISPSGSSVVATGSPPEQSVDVQSTKLSSANFDVVSSIKPRRSDAPLTLVMKASEGHLITNGYLPHVNISPSVGALARPIR
uniref:Enhancer of polycomb-like protein n=1 Tax=Steinernema glaseri TaxID=37863 RepID=A0A1I7ZTX5_9BILA